MKHIASRLAAVRPSASMAASLAAKALMAEGVDVVDLSLGEPDFPTPAHIVDAAYEAAKRGETLYTAPAGTPALREAIARKFEHENGLTFGLNQIAVANGGKQIIFNALMATIDEGDEVILSAPYFVSYPEMVRLVGGIPVSVPCPSRNGLPTDARGTRSRHYPAHQMALPQFAQQSLGRGLFRRRACRPRRGAGAPSAGAHPIG